jgi:hypothetical protein
MVAAVAGGGPTLAAGFCASEVPHILQKFIPGGLTVPHAPQVAPPGGTAAAGFDCAGAAAGAGSSRWPQSWQNSEPSRFTFPQ